jgi:hypothetical protein
MPKREQKIDKYCASIVATMTPIVACGKLSDQGTSATNLFYFLEN